MKLMCLNGGDCQRNGMKVVTEKLPGHKEENKEKGKRVSGIHKPPRQEKEHLDGCIQFPAQDNTIRSDRDTTMPSGKTAQPNISSPQLLN